MQDPLPDSNEATSEGIFVFTSPANVSVGDLVSVRGKVSEYRSGSGNLSSTKLASPAVIVYSSNNPLPAPIVLGTGGRVPPSTVIEFEYDTKT